MARRPPARLNATRSRETCTEIVAFSPGCYLPFKVVRLVPPERANLFFSLLFHKHWRVGWGGGLHPWIPVSCLSYSFFNSIPDKLEHILITESRSMRHMRATSTRSVLKCHLDAAEKSPPNPGLMEAWRGHMKEISPWPLYSRPSRLSRHHRHSGRVGICS